MNPSKRANSALLIGAYQILVLNRSAEEVCDKFQNIAKFVPFCDASQMPSSFELYIGDCLKALEKSVQFSWFSLTNFDVKAYETYAQLECGGLNWIIPNKVLAFVCPSNEIVLHGPMTPERYIHVFSKLGVRSIIRLNNKTYESSRFVKHGFKHHELYFLDGSIPSEAIIREFVQVLEEEGVVAVHCKAGLGRTGTLIGCYAMKHFNISAEEFIAWCRMCRPGSILGPQQQFLCDVQNWCKRWGTCVGPFQERLEVNYLDNEEAFKAKFGDYGQANRLSQKSNSPQPMFEQRNRMNFSPNYRKQVMEKHASESQIRNKLNKKY